MYIYLYVCVFVCVCVCVCVFVCAGLGVLQSTQAGLGGGLGLLKQQPQSNVLGGGLGVPLLRFITLVMAVCSTFNACLHVIYIVWLHEGCVHVHRSADGAGGRAWWSGNRTGRGWTRDDWSGTRTG